MDFVSKQNKCSQPNLQVPQGTRGFPTFTSNGKTHYGLHSSKDELYKKLGISNEGYQYYRESFHNSYKNSSMLGVLILEKEFLYLYLKIFIL